MKTMTANKCAFAIAATVLCLWAGTFAVHATTVTQTGNATTLANALIGFGSGVTVVGTPTFTGTNVAAGTFSGANSIPLGFDSGIILTSGNASIANLGTNFSTAAGANNHLAGDAQLTALGGHPTFDASILTFQFQIDPGATNNLRFDYVFASEEYKESVGSQFDDLFGFYLDGVNIALLPDNNPVSVNTINPGSHASFYRDNPQGSGPGGLGNFHTEYDGLTVVMTASALGLGPGTHTVKLAIADGGDGSSDSAAFIRFQNFAIPEPSSIGLFLTAALIGLRRLRKSR